MITKMISQEHGVCKAAQPLADILLTLKARENTRYAIANAGVISGRIAVANGRQLFAIDLPSGYELADGTYHVTGEGFMLKTEAGNFPKISEIIPSITDRIEEYVLDAAYSYSATIKAIAQKDVMVNFRWLMSFLEKIEKCGCYAIKLNQIGKEKTLHIIGEIQGHKFDYLQIPISEAR